MANITTTINITNTSFFTEGGYYSWTVTGLDGLSSILTLVSNIQPSTINITYDGSLLPAGAAELTGCNLSYPVLTSETCCDVTYYDVPDASFLTDLPGAGVPASAPLGRNILRIGLNSQLPNEAWEYDKSGDPQNLDNWYRVEILPEVVSDKTLTGNGSAGDPLRLASTPTEYINSNWILGDRGTNPGIGATTYSRAAWDAFAGGNTPIASTHSLGLSGHYLDDALNSGTILGGRPGYYSVVTAIGSLTLTAGGDNYNDSLAGVVISQHSDARNGGHAIIAGGSYHQTSGEYTTAIGGTQTKSHTLHGGTIGGINVEIGSDVDPTLSRRQGALFSENVVITQGENSGFVFGKDSRLEGAGGSVGLAGEDQRITADNAVAIGLSSLAEIPGALSMANGKFANQGDNGSHYFSARRAWDQASAVSMYLSNNGGSGVDLFAPGPNTTLQIDADVIVTRTDGGGADLASYKLMATFTTDGAGTITLVNESLLYSHETDAGYHCQAVQVGGNTRVGIKLTAPAGHSGLASASVRLTYHRT